MQRMCNKHAWVVLVLFQVCVRLCVAASFVSSGCEQEGACICKFDNGTKIDLGLLGNKDGPPLIKDFHLGDFAYSFNPCYPFTEGTCENVAGCQFNVEEKDMFYAIGNPYGATLTYSGDVLTGVYTSQDTFGDERSSVVSYTCDPSAKTPKIDVFGEGPLRTYKFSIASMHVCAQGQTTITPTPIPITTVTVKQGCHTNYGDFIKRCEVEYDGHEEPVKVLFVHNWNGICKFPTNKDVAVTLYSESSTCAGVTNRCNPDSAFSVNGEVCKGLD